MLSYPERLSGTASHKKEFVESLVFFSNLTLSVTKSIFGKNAATFVIKTDAVVFLYSPSQDHATSDMPADQGISITVRCLIVLYCFYEKDMLLFSIFLLTVDAAQEAGNHRDE